MLNGLFKDHVSTLHARKVLCGAGAEQATTEAGIGSPETDRKETVDEEDSGQSSSKEDANDTNSDCSSSGSSSSGEDTDKDGNDLHLKTE